MNFDKFRSIFRKFLELSTLKKFFITYFACWGGFLSTIIVGKFLNSFFTVEKAGAVVDAKFEAISTVVASKVGFNYYSAVFSYFINNYLACISIILAFILVSYLYKKEISSGKSTIREYLNSLIIFYLLVIINPLTGILGVDSNFSDLGVVIPHGIFEFAGLAFSIVLGLEYAIYNLPLNETKKYGAPKPTFKKGWIENNVKFLVKVFGAFILIGVAAFMEPLDWAIYTYAKNNGMPVLETIIMVYGNLISHFLGKII